MAVKQAASSAEEIVALHQFSPISNDYLVLIEEATELEIAIDDSEYFRIWGAAGCVEMNGAYQINRNMPGSLAIGDDERGGALVLSQVPALPGLYLVNFGYLNIEGSKFIAPSLTDLLERHVGIDVPK